MATVNGTNGNETLAGDAGNDSISGFGGNDQLEGSAGDDTLHGGDGNDSLFGGDDKDLLTGGTGNDALDGGAGNDTLVGGTGNDTLDGGTGTDTADYSAATSGVNANLQTGIAQDGQGGVDTLIEIDNLIGSIRTDILSGNDNGNLLIGGSGNDQLFGNGGNDSLYGDAGDDILSGGTGESLIFGGAGNDMISAGAENDTIFGGDGNDAVVGGEGNNFLDGGAGNDVFFGGNGADTFFGGSGTDTVSFIMSNSAVTVSLGSGWATQDSTIKTLAQIEAVRGSDFDDAITGSNVANNLDGQAGNDVLFGLDGNDSLSGGSGDDWIRGGQGADRIFGGSGIDTADYADSNSVMVNLATGTGSGNFAAGDSLFGIENVSAGLGNDTLIGNNVDNLLHGGSGNDSLSGAEGNDTLYGGNDNDILFGGDGADLLDGAGGNDTLTGGAGEDRFLFLTGSGADRITDFQLGAPGSPLDQLDVSDLRTLDGNPVTWRDVIVSDDGMGNARLLFPRGESILLEGISPQAINSQAALVAAGVPCFTPGTAILTPRGEVAVDQLRPGDLVSTLDNGPQRLVWVGRRDLVQPAPHLRPVQIRAGVCGNRRDILVSPQHAMLLPLPGQGRADASLLRARHLADAGVAGVRIAQGKRRVSYIHLMFERHQLVFAEGAATESFFPGTQGMNALDHAARAELLELFPDLSRLSPEVAYGPRARPALRRTEVLRGFAPGRTARMRHSA